VTREHEHPFVLPLLMAGNQGHGWVVAGRCFCTRIAGDDTLVIVGSETQETGGGCIGCEREARVGRWGRGRSPVREGSLWERIASHRHGGQHNGTHNLQDDVGTYSLSSASTPERSRAHCPYVGSSEQH
jgi:hypothetical protein